jgi:hypothetical protein
MHYIVSYIKGVVNSFLCDIGKILTAKAKFNVKLPFSKDVHDTHFKSTDADYFFPKDFKYMIQRHSCVPEINTLEEFRDTFQEKNNLIIGKDGNFSIKLAEKILKRV